MRRLWSVNELDNIKGIINIGCWAHAHRKFEQALENDPVPVRYVMLKIQEIYAIERKATEGNFTPDQIKELPEKESFPILEEFESWLLATAQTILLKSPIGKAIFYTYGIYRKPIRYTLDGRYRRQ